jgi:hypothetical protein
MRMLMVVYSGPTPQRIASLLDAHHAGGYTEFRNVHGTGSTGKRESSRAWPGQSTLFVSVLPEPQSELLVETLRTESGRLPAGERLHAAVLPTVTFF